MKHHVTIDALWPTIFREAVVNDVNPLQLDCLRVLKKVVEDEEFDPYKVNELEVEMFGSTFTFTILEMREGQVLVNGIGMSVALTETGEMTLRSNLSDPVTVNLAGYI